MKYVKPFICSLLLFVFVLFHVPASLADDDLASEGKHLDDESSSFVSNDDNGSPTYIFLKHQFDVRKYTLDVKPNLNSGKIKATTTVKCISDKKGLKKILLNFVGDWKIKKVMVDGKAANWKHNGYVLNIKLGSKFDSGVGFEASVTYKGTPQPDPEFHWEVPTFYVQDGIYANTHFEPFQARYFYPCFDEPSDKAEEGCDVIVTVPKNLTAVANGLLIETKEKGKKKIFHYSHKYPIATYLIAFAVAPFEVIEDKCGKIPVIHHVFTEYMERAEFDFERTPQMIRCFSDLFGPYPFEKYGMVMAHGSPGMEHQTITFIPTIVVTGDRRVENGVAHELSHHWWGNAVTITDFRDIWLKEGLCRYCEALWLERAEGAEARDYRVQQFRSYYFTYDNVRRNNGEEPLAIYPRDYQTENLYRWRLTYSKSATVFHMLRWELGDKKFFKGLKKLYNDNLHGYVDGTKLKNTMESVSGKDLDDFFQSWVYSPGHPEFEISSSYKTVEGQLKNEIIVEQVQDFATTFPMTLLIDPDGEGALAAQRMFVSGRSTSFDVDVPAQAGAAQIIDTPWHVMRVVSGN